MCEKITNRNRGIVKGLPSRRSSRCTAAAETASSRADEQEGWGDWEEWQVTSRAERKKGGVRYAGNASTKKFAGSDGRRGRRGDKGQLWGVETYADVVVHARLVADGGLGDDV